MAVLPRRQLQASTVWMALVPGSVLGHSKTALHPVLLTPRSSYPTLRVWALCLSRQRALGEGIRVLYQWPPWEGFPYGIGFDAMWLLSISPWFRLGLVSFWWITAAQMLQFYLLCFCRGVFFFHLQDFFLSLFCHQKNTFEPHVPSWSWLTSVDNYILSVVGPSSSTISNTVMHIMQHCDLI